MKIGKIALVAITLTTGFALNAQETNGNVKSQDEKVKIDKNQEVASLSLTPEQISINKTNALKAKVQLTEEQEASVKSLFFKIESKKTGLASLPSDEKENALNQLQSIEDKELDSILSPEQRKVHSGSKTTTTKTATNM